MKKTQLFGIIIFAILMLIIPNNINAKEENYTNEYGYQTSSISENKSNYIIHNMADEYNQPQTCDGNNGILGSYNDPNSVAWFLQKIFDYTKLIGPFIVVVMSGIDFAKVIFTGDDEGMKKAQSKLIIRLILAACLFVLPDLLSALLELFNITSSGICGLQ